ncbi:hypothetical protein OQA88_1721 [Cercophora sp. LCS_1]
MVKIAIAGGSGELGREVIDVLVASGKHDITILTRNSSVDPVTPGATHRPVDYDNHGDLVQALTGIHTVLSFVNQLMEPPEINCQKNLINACIAAGVTRFAPSEYGSASKENVSFWAKKQQTQDYLEEVNKDSKVLEYTLFQPGLFLDYLASPHKTAKYVTPLDTFIDFHNRRAIVVQGHEDAVITLTLVRDIANLVAQAVDYPGSWPKNGGISGNRLTISELLTLAERIRGPFTITRIPISTLQSGSLPATFSLTTRHPSYTPTQTAELEAMLRHVLISILLSLAAGAWDVSPVWNTLLPSFTFTPIEAFLSEIWKDKA